MSEHWDRHWLGMCLYHLKKSKDPNTRVGAFVIGPDNEILSGGFNGLPRGIADTPERLNNRDLKLKLIVHAEMNALLSAARTGTRIKGSTLYIACTDDTGEIWGGPPCTRCCVEAIQVGIGEVVTFPFKAESKWLDDIAMSKMLLSEARIMYREIRPPTDLRA